MRLYNRLLHTATSVTKLIVADNVGAAIGLIKIALAIMHRLVFPDGRVAYTIQINSERGVRAGSIIC